MISCYEGVLGGGKSYHAVAWALRYLARGGRIYSNIRLKPQECSDWVARFNGSALQWDEQFTYLSPDDIRSLHEVVRGGSPGQNTLVILDEIHLYHNSRDWATASRGLLNWLTQSRKLFTDIIMITQHRNNVDKQWIRLIGRFWHFRDLRNWKVPGLGIRIPFFECLSVEIDQDGRTVLEKHFERFDKSVFSCYDSDQLFDGASLGFLPSGNGFVQLSRSSSAPWVFRAFDALKNWWSRRSRFMKLGCVFAGVAVVALLGYAGLTLTGYLRRSRPSDSSLSSPSSVSEKNSPPILESPTESPFVVCYSWYGSPGRPEFAYADGLSFRGLPLRWVNGCPVYARVQGTPYP